MKNQYFADEELFELFPGLDEFEMFEGESGNESWESEDERNNRNYIRWVQQTLNKVLGLRLATDGKMGPATRSAIRSFQRRQGLKVDGNAGPETRQSLINARKLSLSNSITSEVSLAERFTIASGAKSPIKSLSCSESELTEVRKIVGHAITKAQLQKVVETVATQAANWAWTAALALETKPLSQTTAARFFEAFARETNFIPPWRPPNSWEDFGDLISIRLRNAAKIIDGGQIRYFCWGSKAHCPECTGSPQVYFACSSFKGSYRICLGKGFWQSWKAGDTATMAAVLLHEALHIYYGRTVSDLGSSGNANCYERYVLSINDQLLHPATTSACPINLRRGDMGLPVRELQNRINRWIDENPGHGLQKRNVDGRFGPKTESDVKEIQRIHGLDDDGIVGRDIWKVLPPKRHPMLWLGRPCGANNPSVSCANNNELKYRLNLWLMTQPGVKLLPLDQIFDSTTEDAVKLFQRKHGLKDDGKVDEQTWKALPQY